MKDDIKFYPPKFKNTYRHWMENIKDWCISRQLGGDTVSRLTSCRKVVTW